MRSHAPGEGDAALSKPNESHSVRLLVVIVLYKLPPLESPSLRSLLASVEHAGASVETKTLLWDNTPGGHLVTAISSDFQYHAAPHNPGLSAAYNYAIELSRTEGFDWLLTLDQDTDLPLDFVSRVANAARDLPARTSTIVPRIVGDGRELSPFHFIAGTIPTPWSGQNIKGPVYAVNSAATHRVDALKAMGGYSELFPLDASDLQLFHRLHEAGNQVSLLDGVTVVHNFSLLDKHGRMSLDRYKLQLFDECGFWDQYMSTGARIERMIRLAGRAVKDLFKPNAWAFQRITIREFIRRLRTRRPKRIALWHTMAAARAARNREQ